MDVTGFDIGANPYERSYYKEQSSLKFVFVGRTYPQYVDVWNVIGIKKDSISTLNTIAKNSNLPDI